MRIIFILLAICGILFAAGENLISNGIAATAKKAPLTNCTLENGSFKFVENGKPSYGEMFPIDISKPYEFTAVLRGAETSSVTAKLQLFTKDGKYLSIIAVSPKKETLTKLLQPIKKGDTSIIVEDASNWDFKAANLLVFDAKEDLSDLPNVHYEYYARENTKVLLASKSARMMCMTCSTFSCDSR
jgi:hypothetical protein